MSSYQIFTDATADISSLGMSLFTGEITVDDI